MISNVRTTKQLKNPGPYLAKIVSHLDPQYMGTLQVELLHDVGNMPERTGQLFQVRYLNPFYGVTSYDHTGKNSDHNDTQKSYGMWMVPPDIGTTVMVIFVDGNTSMGFWMGCVQDQYMNFMIPGMAATTINNKSGKLPVCEFNKKTNPMQHADTTQVPKPVHPFADVLNAQGLLNDETRGITTSSARREAPSSVFGISTPGPVDRRVGAKRGKIGQHESKVVDAFVSRLGGSTFVMDDGDANLLRKGPASTNPPVYASVPNKETGGNVTIPHNELIRIRTRTGHQILLHNSEDLIYIANARGTAWIELTSNGKIDIWAADSISMHTGKDFNITADNNINFTAGKDINLFASGSINNMCTNDFNLLTGGNFKATASSNYEIKAGADGKLTAGGSNNLLSTGALYQTASTIYQNGITASAASSATSAIIASRVPMTEPWNGHENLHGAVPSAVLDTFRKIGK